MTPENERSAAPPEKRSARGFTPPLFSADDWYSLSDLPGEIWRPVYTPEYSDYYYVSNMGRVRTVERTVRFGNQWRTIKPRILKPYPHNNNKLYPTVRLPAPGEEQRFFFVHALVGEAFIGEKPPGYQVCHGNNDGWDNRLENLRYCSPKENQADRRVHGTMLTGEKHPNSKLSKADVQRISEMYATGEYSQYKLADMFDVAQGHVSRIVRGQAWAA